MIEAAPALDAVSRLTRDLDAAAAPMSLSVQILVLMTLLTVLPSLLLLSTAFLRIIVVLSILRQAIGLPQTPPNQVLVAMALLLTAVVMAPTFRTLEARAVAPYAAGEMPLSVAIETGGEVMRGFMMAQTRKSDLAAFTALAGTPPGAPPSFATVLAAFITSELTTAFQIGFLLFLPFLVIDLIVASVLTALGMMMLSPAMIALPFKLLLFVLVDGWALTFGALAKSFAGGG